MEREVAENLARFSTDQLKYRLVRYATRADLPSEVVRTNEIIDFFNYLIKIPDSPETALVKPEHRFDATRFAEDKSFFTKMMVEMIAQYEPRLGSPDHDKEVFLFYPRAAIIPSMIESDIAQVSATREKPGLVEINKVIGPIFTFGLRGRHVFSTVHEYQRLLRDRTLRDVIRASLAARKSYSEEQIRQAPYFALFRADKYTEKPKAKGAGGWYKNWDIQKSIPVLVIPNIGGADLDKLIEIEKAALAE